jgi:hypothetical protein
MRLRKATGTQAISWKSERSTCNRTKEYASCLLHQMTSATPGIKVINVADVADESGIMGGLGRARLAKDDDGWLRRCWSGLEASSHAKVYFEHALHQPGNWRHATFRHSRSRLVRLHCLAEQSLACTVSSLCFMRHKRDPSVIGSALPGKRLLSS